MSIEDSSEFDHVERTKANRPSTIVEEPDSTEEYDDEDDINNIHIEQIRISSYNTKSSKE